MSRFFAASESDSDSSSTDSEEYAPTAGARKAAPVPHRALLMSDDEDETRRVVRTEKDKRYDELKTIIKSLKQHKNIKDMSSIQSDFDSMMKIIEKARKVVEAEGLPAFFLKTVIDLEEFINECWEDKEWRKNISRNNSKNLAKVRQEIRKYTRENEAEVELYKATPRAEEEEEEEGRAEAEVSSDVEVEKPVVKPSKPAKEPKKVAFGDDDDDEDEWPSSSEASSSSDDEAPQVLTAAYFLKDSKDKDKDSKKKKDLEKKKEKAKLKKEEREEEEDNEGFIVVEGKHPTKHEMPKIFEENAEITVDLVNTKLAEFVAQRGRKGTDRSMQIANMLELRQIAQRNKLGIAIDIKILFNVVGAVFDYNPNIAISMKKSMWNRCLNVLRELLDVVLEHEVEVVLSDNILEDAEHLEGEPPFRIRGCLLTLAERMDEEYTKMLQACDAHSTEYVHRLKDEAKVCKIIQDLQKYIEDHGTTEERCRIYMKHIEHIHYKSDSLWPGSLETMNELCQFLYTKDTTDRLRTRAILCHIYHHALNDRWYKARDLMLMSHLQETIHQADIPTQIMYNRGMVQLGLCAFRKGMIRDAHNCLVDIQSSGRAKELLAQGLLQQRQHERTAEQEKIEKRRLMPYHMHINLECLECVYLVSAMLIEIPYMAAHEMDNRRRMISKNFHHVLRKSERETLVGPPEIMREHIVAASKAMKKGDWKACLGYVINEKMNSKVWDLFMDSEGVRNLLDRKVKEESLRTYLFTYSSIFDSLSLEVLAEQFELPRDVVHSVVSKMIINEELMASMDEPSQCVIMHRTNPSQLQSLALQLSEKVGTLVDYNEKLMEMKSGNYFYQTRQNQGGHHQGGHHQGGHHQGGHHQGGHHQGGHHQGGHQQQQHQDRYQYGRRQGGGGQSNRYWANKNNEN